jgi:hypothetical protein
MWAPRNAGVFLQEIKIPQYKEITIKLIKENTENNTDPFNGDNSIDEKDVEAITKLALAYGKLSRRFGISAINPGANVSHFIHTTLTGL